jgi:hypothetical protein
MVVVELDHRDPDVALRVRDLQRAAYRVEAELIRYDQMPPSERKSPTYCV